MLSTNHCSTIPTTMNRIWWIEPNYNFAPITLAVHIKVVVVGIQEAHPCGMQIVCWCPSAKLVIDSVISILFHVSENRFITTPMPSLRIPCRINYYYYEYNVSFHSLSTIIMFYNELLYFSGSWFSQLIFFMQSSNRITTHHTL